MGFVDFMMARTLEGMIVVLLIAFMPNIPPYVNFTGFRVTPSKPLEGKLASNERLNGVQHIYENELKGPEAFADYNGELYASLQTGDIVKLTGDHVVPVVRFGKPCRGSHEEAICGRPLGMAFDKDGYLYVADAYHGVWKVDIKTGEKTQLVSMDKEIEGRKPKLPNSIAVSKNGDIYWTDSSTDFTLEDGVYIVLGDPTGRLIHYNPKTKRNTVLIDGLHFANGLAFSDDEEFLVVAETMRSRIHRYYLKGPKEGTQEIFIDGLPGIPDNIKSDGNGGFLVPLIITRDASHPLLFQSVGPFPLIRKFISRFMALGELGLRTAERIYPTFLAQTALHWIGNFEAVYVVGILPSRVAIVHLSKDGEILEILHNTDKKMSDISEIHIFDDYAYFGSPWNPYVARKPLASAGLLALGRYKEESLKRASRDTLQQEKEAPKPTTPPTPKPTVAPPTPKPTVAPVKDEPIKKSPPVAPTEAPVKKAAAQNNQTPPPKPQVKETPQPKVAAKQAPPTKTAPVKETPTKAAPKEVPPPKVAPVTQAPPPPKVAPVTQTPPPKAAPVKDSTPPKTATVKDSTPPKTAPVQDSAPKQAPVKDSAPKQAPVKESPTKPAKDPVVPMKDKVQPKTETIPPRK